MSGSQPFMQMLLDKVSMKFSTPLIDATWNHDDNNGSVAMIGSRKTVV